MGYKLSKANMNEVLSELSKQYRVFGPKWDRPHKNIKFLPLQNVDEMVLDQQTDFSAKEVFYPISQVMFYFHGDNVTEAQLADDRDILIFARACDINALMPLDQIFLCNGKMQEDENKDFFYERLRKKVKFALLPCNGGFEHCFCVSTNTNKTTDYAFAVLPEDVWMIDIKDDTFASYFEGFEVTTYTPSFVTKNQKELMIPDICADKLLDISQMEYWNQFDEMCIGCGGCNTVCGTCSCFDTVDVTYTDGHSDGERKRVWSSCMIDTFTQTAGGARARATAGANMRFKVFHKFYDFKERFCTERNMCVGCGRCDMRCPKDISFFDTVCGLATQMKEER